MNTEKVTVTPLMDDDTFIYDTLQARCIPRKDDGIERMECGLYNDVTGDKLRSFDGLFRMASAVGNGLIMTKGDDVTIISASQISKDAFGKCSKVAYPDGENQLLCKFWKLDEFEGGK